MRIGTRIVYPREVGIWQADFLQISVYHFMKGNLAVMKDCVKACREASISYVIHPVGYSTLNKEMLGDILTMAEWADLGIILHDERTPDGGRLTGQYETQFVGAVDSLRSLTSVSFENATSTKDVQWFWDTYADSITVDIGHVEEAGIDSAAFVKSLDSATLRKIEYVHMHRNNGWHGGLTDHWPLLPDCNEVNSLRELLRRKSDIGVLLEINETEMTGENLRILRELRNEL